jgi:hypothetical protein
MLVFFSAILNPYITYGAQNVDGAQKQTQT